MWRRRNGGIVGVGKVVVRLEDVVVDLIVRDLLFCWSPGCLESMSVFRPKAYLQPKMQGNLQQLFYTHLA